MMGLTPTEQMILNGFGVNRFYTVPMAHHDRAGYHAKYREACRSLRIAGMIKLYVGTYVEPAVQKTHWVYEVV